MFYQLVVFVVTLVHGTYGQFLCDFHCVCIDTKVDCYRQNVTVYKIQFHLPLDTTELSLEDNRLSHLPKDTFDRLTSLQRLNLNTNLISSLPHGIFDKLTSLEYLNLAGNQISSLPANIFDQLTSLTHLNLTGNQISSLPADIFDQLTSLTHLLLFWNPLQCCGIKGIIQWTNSTLKNLDDMGECKFQDVKFNSKDFDIKKCFLSGRPQRCNRSRK